jgi:lysyl-tRNA synthetase class 2
VVYNFFSVSENIMNIPEFTEIIEPNDQTEARNEHLEKLRALVGNVYPNKFDRSRVTGAEDTITRINGFEEITRHIPQPAEGERPEKEAKDAINAKLKEFGNVRIAGRLATPPRLMGKAAFVHLSDGISRLQIYVRRDDVKGVANDAENSEVSGWEIFGLLDHGDFVGVEGFLFITNTGELSVHVEKLQFLSKAMLPMPDKMHGIADPEIKRRYRYADLIASSLQVEREPGELTTREVFERRARLISGMRRYLDEHGYIEVETPMLTPKATGAAAKPFETFHEALKIPLYARIAPELYLKRLTVGGFEKVYELNRNFRNEGLSQKHNPEFTMLEFYCAYMDVNGMMDFAEVMIKEAVKKAVGNLEVKLSEVYTHPFTDEKHKTERVIDFSKFARLTMQEAIANSMDWLPVEKNKFNAKWFDSISNCLTLKEYLEDIEASERTKRIEIQGIYALDKSEETTTRLIAELVEKLDINEQKYWIEAEQKIKALTLSEIESRETESAKIVVDLFEKYVEHSLIQPTFIIDYPKSISPLSKASPENPNIAERFELFINGMECANGFSELNDPREQYERFVEQMRERETGDEEAMVLDEDYIRALSYGMPPAAGIGIGIDRLVMLLTNKHSIRDVILFPHLRPERKALAADGAEEN